LNKEEQSLGLVRSSLRCSVRDAEEDDDLMRFAFDVRLEEAEAE